ncbi:hypothetical protein Tco_1488551, partial [Tanacetum coccineum]
GNQRDYFSNDTFRGRSLVSSAVYYEVTPPVILPLQHVFGGVTSSTNGAVNTAHGAPTASTQATTVNSTIIDNLSDVVICAFFASQPNNPYLDNEDLQQIHHDDLEEMDLRWQMAIDNGYLQKDKNRAKTDKTKHGNEKSVKS